MLTCWCLGGIWRLTCYPLLISIKHKVQHRLMWLSSVLQVFWHKLKYFTNLNFDLMMAQGDHQSYNNSSWRDMSAKCHGNPSDSCLLYFSRKTTNVNLMVALEETSGDRFTSVRFILWGTWMRVQNFMTIYHREIQQGVREPWGVLRVTAGGPPNYS